MLQNLLFVIIGLVGLYYGGEWLVQGASRLARSFGIPALIIGLTVVAFGTSTPELVVSVSAALGGSGDIAIGNVVGSNIANIGLILGITGFIFPIAVHIAFLRREIPILLVVTLVALLLSADGQITRLDGGLMVVGLLVYLGTMVVFAQQNNDDAVVQQEKVSVEAEYASVDVLIRQRGRELLRLLVGLGILLIGAQLTVEGAVNIAREIGISELVIGLTMVAVGTSLPELATSAIAALRKHSDIAIGNIVGSNIFNLLCILGITAVINPITVNQRVITFDGIVMVGFAVLLLPLIWDRVLGRREGTLLLLLYTLFVIYTFGGSA